jgi:hypothetical protein
LFKENGILLGEILYACVAVGGNGLRSNLRASENKVTKIIAKKIKNKCIERTVANPSSQRAVILFLIQPPVKTLFLELTKRIALMLVHTFL